MLGVVTTALLFRDSGLKTNVSVKITPSSVSVQSLLPTNIEIETQQLIASGIYWVLDTDNEVWLVDLSKQIATSVLNNKDAHYALPYKVVSEQTYNERVVHVETYSFDGDIDLAWHFDFDGNLLAVTEWVQNFFTIYPHGKMSDPTQIQFVYTGCGVGLREDDRFGPSKNPGTVTGVKVGQKEFVMKTLHDVPCVMHDSALGVQLSDIDIGKPSIEYVNGKNELSFSFPWGTSVSMDIDHPTSTIRSTELK